jgi:hypothetical protein
MALGFAWYALSGELINAVKQNTLTNLFSDYINLKTTYFMASLQPLFFHYHFYYKIFR